MCLLQCAEADPCDGLTQCINMLGSYACTLCPPGYLSRTDGNGEVNGNVTRAGIQWAKTHKQASGRTF